MLKNKQRSTPGDKNLFRSEPERSIGLVFYKFRFRRSVKRTSSVDRHSWIRVASTDSGGPTLNLLVEFCPNQQHNKLNIRFVSRSKEEKEIRFDTEKRENRFDVEKTAG